MIQQMTLMPDALHKGIQLRIEHSVSVDNWIRERHYLRSVPAGAIIRMCFETASHEIIGCMLWGHPTARKLDQESILELTRMFFVDETEPFVESKCLAMARKHIRRHHGHVKGLIAYSSSGMAHEGTVYRADNWYMLGVTKSASWETRKGRTNRDLSEKTRWTRSP